MIEKIKTRLNIVTAFFRYFSAGRKTGNKIFFITYNGKYICNPKYITEKLLQKAPSADLVWAVMNVSEAQMLPDGVRWVLFNSADMFYEMMTARVCIDNALNCVWHRIPKSDRQIYINTWHGSLGIKKLSGTAKWNNRAERNNRYTDYYIVNSVFEENIFRNGYWPDCKYLMYGHPRNDILFQKSLHAAVRKKVDEILGTENCRIALYAPTFREDLNLSFMNIDFERLKRVLELKFGGEWKILCRLHSKNSAHLINNDYFVDASSYPDIQELMAAADVGITDYSSWIFDFVLTRKPGFIYAADLDDYRTGKGFYYPITQTPFSVSSDNDELEQNIMNFDYNEYNAAAEKFLAEKGCCEDGSASEKTVDKILDIMA